MYAERTDLGVWTGKVADGLKGLAQKYASKNAAISQDEYEGLCYDTMTYDKFAGGIGEAPQRHCCMVDVVG